MGISGKKVLNRRKEDMLVSQHEVAPNVEGSEIFMGNIDLQASNQIISCLYWCYKESEAQCTIVMWRQNQ